MLQRFDVSRCCCEHEATVTLVRFGDVTFRNIGDTAERDPWTFESPVQSGNVCNLWLADKTDEPTGQRRVDLGVAWYLNDVPAVTLTSFHINFHGGTFLPESMQDYLILAAIRDDIDENPPTTQVPQADFTSGIAWSQSGPSWYGGGSGVYPTTPDLSSIVNQVTALPGWDITKSLLLVMRVSTPVEPYTGLAPPFRYADELFGTPTDATATFTW